MKYELLKDNTRFYMGKTLYRIRAVESFHDVEAGDLGGWVEDEFNLSHVGDCWIYDDAIVYGNARISDNSRIMNKSKVYDNALIYDNAVICDSAEVFEHARVYGEAKMFGESRAFGISEIFGKAKLFEHVRVSRDAWVYGNIEVRGSANITATTTRQPIVLHGLYYNITIMDRYISIDCESHNIYDWMHMDRDAILAMDGKAGLEFYDKYYEMVKAMVMSVRPEYNQENE